MAANNKSIGAEDDRAEEEKRRLKRQLKSLWRITQMTDASHNELCALVLEEIQKLTDSQYSFFGFLTEDESTLIVHSWSKTAMTRCAVVDSPIHFPIKQAGLWSRAVVERKPLLINDYHLAHAHKKGLPDGHVPLKKFLSVPILEKSKVTALAAVANKADDYNNEDVMQIQTFVSNILLIIQKKRSDEILNERVQMYHSVLETINDGIIMQAASGEILLWNKGAAEIIGITPEEAIGETSESKDWPLIYEDGSKYEGKDHVSMRTLRTGKPYHNEIVGICQPDGNVRWISVNTNPLFRPHETSPYAVATSFSDITDLKREKDLSQTYLDIAGVMFMALNIKGDIVSINKKGCEILEASEEDLLGKNWFETCLPKTSVQKTWQIFGELMAGRVTSVEYTEEKVLTLTGQEKIIAWHNTVMKNDRGEITGTFSSGEDITERKAAEEALKQSEASLRMAQEIAYLGNWIWEIKSNKVHWSDQFTRILGFEPGKVSPSVELARQRIHPDDISLEMAAAKKAFETPGKMYEVENRIVHPDGTVRYVSSRGMVSEWCTDNTPSVMVGTTQDITERKLAEQALQKSAEQHRSILETAMDGYWMVDSTGRFLEVNKTYCRMSGYSEQELLSMNITDVEAVETAKQVLDRIKTLAAKGEDRFESQHRRKDGTVYDIEASVQYRADDGGRYICFIRDITENKKMKARLVQAQKMESIGNLAGGIAHDFNNILFPIVGLAEMLIDDLPAGSPERQRAKEILKAGMRGGNLVKQILAFSRQSENQKVPVHFQRILQEVLKLIRSTIPASIDINQDIQKECGMIMADPTQLHQIVMNLITNAYHALEDTDGRIDIQLNEVLLENNNPFETSLKAGHYARLTITDSGCGIHPEMMDKIFEPYFTTKEQGRGTGLGLAVVFGIVKEHGGEIKVYSELGSGTTFTVYLPLIEDSAELAHQDSTEQLPHGNEHILIVDDESAIVNLEKLIIERLGYQVTARFSSMDALEAFKASPDEFDLVITDMTMPNMTGDRLAKALFSIRPDIPVIICTGFSEKINRDMAEAIGVKGFLMKPIVRSELAGTVRRILDESR